MACGAKGGTKTRLDTPGYPAETRAVVPMMMECVCVCMKGVGHAANLYHLDADGVGVHSATQARNAAGRKNDNASHNSQPNSHDERKTRLSRRRPIVAD